MRRFVSYLLFLTLTITANAANVRTGGPFPGTSIGTSVTLLDDGRIVTVGGGYVHIWEPERRQWMPSREGQAQPRRSFHIVTRFGDERIVFVGGLDADGNGRNQRTALSSVTIWRPKQNLWESAPGLLAPRFAHASVALPTGEILVIGGTSTADRDEPFGPFLATTELLGEKTTTARAPMRAARVHHTATLLKDGRIMVIGGIADDRSVLASTEIYDPKTDTWLAGPPLNEARTDHATVLLPDGRVLVTGGADAAGEPVARTEVWSGSEGQWQRSGELLAPRSGHVATLLQDGSVLLTGGILRKRQSVKAIERLRPGLGGWEMAGEVPLEMRGHQAAQLPDGSVLLFGTDTYSRAATLVWLPDEREDLRLDSVVSASLTELEDGRFLLAGGSRRQSIAASASLYDPRTNRWTSTAPMHFARYHHRATRLPDGRVLVVGGESSSAEVWDPATARWSVVDERELVMPTLGEPRDLSDRLVVNDRETSLWLPEEQAWVKIAHDTRWSSVMNVVIAADGRILAFRHTDMPGRSFQRLGVVWLNAQARRWQPLTDDYVERELPALLALGDEQVMVAGGATALVQIWNARTAKWRFTAPLPAPLRSPSILGVKEGVMVAGRVSGEETTVLCALWNPGTEQWSECGRFVGDRAGERKAPVLRDLGAGQVLLVHGNERAMVRSADGTWSATKLNFPKSDAIPYPKDDGTAYATDIGSVWNPMESRWVDATDVLYAHRHGTQAVRTPEGSWVFSGRGTFLQWEPAARLLTRLPFDREPEAHLDSVAFPGKECAVVWNGTREVSASHGGGPYHPVMYARDFAKRAWSPGFGAPSSPVRATSIVLNGRVLVTGSSRDDLSSSGAWQAYEVPGCEKVVALTPVKSLSLPTRPPSATPDVLPAGTGSSPKPRPEYNYVETWKASVLGIVQSARKHIQSTLIFGGLTLLLAVRASTRWGHYEVDDEGRTPGRFVDLTVLAVSACVLIASLGAPWPLPRTLALVIASLLIIFVAKRLWANIPAQREKVLYGVPLGAGAVVCALTVGSVIASKLFQIIDSLRDL